MVRIVSVNFTITLAWKGEFNISVWRHKQLKPSNNDRHMPLIEKLQWSAFFCWLA